jgi:diaminopimelate decarboxylase
MSKKMLSNVKWKITGKNQPLKATDEEIEYHTELITIKIKFCGLCGSDIHVWGEDWGDAGAQTLGHEIVGEVVHVPSTITTRFLIGDIVGVGWQSGSCHDCNYCERKMEWGCEKISCTSFDNPHGGGFARYIQVEHKFVFLLGKMKNYANVSPFLCGGITAFKPLYNNMSIAAKSLGIVGFGGIGRMALIFGKILYEEVHVISSSTKKRDDALNDGATSFSVLSELTEDTMFDIALVTSCHHIDMNKLMKSMKKGGRIVMIGMPHPSMYTYDNDILVNNAISIQGTNIASPSLMQTMIHFIQKYDLDTKINVDVEPIEHINTCLEKMANGKLSKRIVLQLHDEPLTYVPRKPLSEVKKYNVSHDEVKGIVLQSNIDVKKGGIYHIADGLHTKELSQHSLFDYSKNVHIVRCTDDEYIPYYLSHSDTPNLKLHFPGNVLYAIEDIARGDELSMNYTSNEPVLYKQFSAMGKMVTGYKEEPHEVGPIILPSSLDIFTYNNIRYKDDLLHFHDICLQHVAEMYHPDVPTFVYSKCSIQQNIQRIKRVMGTLFQTSKLHFSIKSNSTESILSHLQFYGCDYLDACSPSEVEQGLRCGYSMANIQYTSSYLSNLDIQKLNRWTSIKINIDSMSVIPKLKHSKIGVRINPMAGMSYNCQPNLQCTFAGSKPSKMGILMKDLDTCCKIAKENGKYIERLHCHAGNSYLSDDINGSFEKIVTTIRQCIDICASHGFQISEINFGGGYGVPYTVHDKPFDWSKWADVIKTNIDTTDICVSIEPGDYIIKSSGIILSNINTIEEKDGYSFLGLGVGMNLNAMPAYYNIMSLPMPLRLRPGASKSFTVVGNLNESIDVWANDLEMTPVRVGDYIALLNSGGYSESCQSNHSLRTTYNKILL